MKFSIYQASRIGGRQYNQDRVAYAYSDQALLLVLADGMGGHSYGELAAHLAIQTFIKAFKEAAQPRISNPSNFLSHVMQNAHTAIIRYAREQKLDGNPGTTCVAAIVMDDQIFWAHAGDSRLYLIRGDDVVTRTKDHSVVQQWADSGMIEAKDMRTHPDRNKITNCLGAEEGMFFVDSSAAQLLQKNDCIILCSDGLWGPLSGQEIASTLNLSPLPQALEQLMDRAIEKEAGHSDNITVVGIRWGEGEEMRIAAMPVAMVLDCEQI